MSAPVVDPPVEPPSGMALARATGIAVAIAGLVLVCAILPAEYGIDPTGAGTLLGLSNMANAEPPMETMEPAWAGPLEPQDRPFISDTRTFTIPANGRMEFKYRLASGAAMLYNWRSSQPLEFDFHTEPADQPPEASESYEKGEADGKIGSYKAPYDGIHGWFWRNSSGREATLTLEAVGYFSGARLFHRDGSFEEITLAPEPPR